MSAGVYRIAAALAMLAVPVVAAAQVIPPSEQPGRERERFTQPPAPLAQPGAPVVTLPSTTAPPGAENIAVFVREIQIVGSTVYSPDQLAVLYQGMPGREWSLKSIYDLAQRITAKYGNDGYVLSRAIVPPQQLSPTSTFCEADSFYIKEIGLLLVTIGLGPCVLRLDDLR